MHLRRNFISINEGFVCKKCGKEVPPSNDGSCRNHCPLCLWSLHVDKEVPGDRESECMALMQPIGMEVSKRKGLRIHHMCQQCGHKSWNRSASDDNYDLICELSRIPQQ
jgi:ribosomal protein L37E